MSGSSQPIYRSVFVTEQQRDVLHQWIADGKGNSKLAQRARVILGCEAGTSLRQIARDVGIAYSSVRLWRDRYLDEGVEGLYDHYDGDSSKRAFRVPQEIIDRIVQISLHEPPPPGKPSWSPDAVAAVVGVEEHTVRRIWRVYHVKPVRRRLPESLPEGAPPAERDEHRLGLVIEQLVDQREKRNISQLDLATRMGISQPSLSRIESNAKPVLVEELQRYARALGVELEISVKLGDAVVGQ